jgi:hypothetical protein
MTYLESKFLFFPNIGHLLKITIEFVYAPFHLHFCINLSHEFLKLLYLFGDLLFAFLIFLIVFRIII